MLMFSAATAALRLNEFDAIIGAWSGCWGAASKSSSRSFDRFRPPVLAQAHQRDFPRLLDQSTPPQDFSPSRVMGYNNPKRAPLSPPRISECTQGYPRHAARGEGFRNCPRLTTGPSGGSVAVSSRVPVLAPHTPRRSQFELRSELRS